MRIKGLVVIQAFLQYVCYVLLQTRNCQILASLQSHQTDYGFMLLEIANPYWCSDKTLKKLKLNAVSSLLLEEKCFVEVVNSLPSIAWSIWKQQKNRFFRDIITPWSSLWNFIVNLLYCQTRRFRDFRDLTFLLFSCNLLEILFSVEE